MHTLGYGNWLLGYYGGNFVPLFKLFWSGLIFGGNGNYHLLLIGGFFLHMSFLFLLGNLLRIWGFGWFSIVFCQLIIGLNYTHIEILSWSTQSSNLLSYIFFMGILLLCSRAYLRSSHSSWVTCGVIALLSLAGALCFPRGVLNGISLLGLCVVLFVLKDPRGRYLWKPAACAFIPCIAIALMTAVWLSQYSLEFSQSESKLDLVVSHFYHRISLNPWFQQIRDLQISGSLSLVLIQLNLIVIFLGIRLSNTRQRPLFYLLILFFLGNAVLLSLGRYHLPVASVAAWRYQYGALIVFVPFVGLIAEKLLELIWDKKVRTVLSVLILILGSQWVFKPWQMHLPDWAQDRGVYTRELIVSEDVIPSEHTISRFYEITNERAIELNEKYNLH